ncbi:nucleoside triphosphate pyrophosphohydrolase [Camelimonas sp. ID_303_24]
MATTGRDITNLLAIMARLRDPETGCAWDVAQSFATIAPYTIEEAHEVADAIQRNDLEDLCEELGDLLLQVVFHARIAEEAGAFTFADVVEAITAKMVRRHPHVFGESPDRSPEAIGHAWQRIKAAEKAARRARRAAAGQDGEAGLLSDVPAGLPPLSRALKLQQRAATVGFDWPDAAQVMDKVDEEINEIKQELEKVSTSGSSSEPTPQARADLASEIGDALFALVNLARHTAIDPEQALASANQKFSSRFNYIEKSVHKSGKTLREASLDEMEEHWREAKQLVRSEGAA